jgi:hypothetical protein
VLGASNSPGEASFSDARSSIMFWVLQILRHSSRSTETLPSVALPKYGPPSSWKHHFGFYQRWSVFWMKTYTPGFGIHEWSILKGIRRVKYSGIALSSVRRHETMMTLTSSRTTLVALFPTTQLFPARRIQRRLGRKHFVQLMHRNK